MKTLEETYYVQTLEEFIKRCNQEGVTLDWIRAKMPPLLKAVRWPVSVAEVVRVLGVGSGNGNIDTIISFERSIMDIDVLKHVQQECPENQLHCIGIEPNPDELTRYKKRAADDKDISPELLPSHPDYRFHVIHMFQMLYHVRDMEETIMNYWEKLIEGGLMVITIASKDGNDLLQAFEDYEATLPDLPELPVQNKKRYSDDVLPILRRNGIHYRLENVSYQVDISDCFVKASKAGKLLLDFICLTNATRVYESLAGGNRSALLNYLSNYCKCGNEGQMNLNLTFDCITFFKGEAACNGVKDDALT